MATQIVCDRCSKQTQRPKQFTDSKSVLIAQRGMPVTSDREYVVNLRMDMTGSVDLCPACCKTIIETMLPYICANGHRLEAEEGAAER